MTLTLALSALAMAFGGAAVVAWGVVLRRVKAVDRAVDLDAEDWAEEVAYRQWVRAERLALMRDGPVRPLGGTLQARGASERPETPADGEWRSEGRSGDLVPHHRRSPMEHERDDAPMRWPGSVMPEEPCGCDARLPVCACRQHARRVADAEPYRCARCGTLCTDYRCACGYPRDGKGYADAALTALARHEAPDWTGWRPAEAKAAPDCSDAACSETATEAQLVARAPAANRDDSTRPSRRQSGRFPPLDGEDHDPGEPWQPKQGETG